MNIGDKVRLVRSKEEGVVTKFLKNDVVEVEIEEGFRLPVLRRELAIVSTTETKIFKPEVKIESVIVERKKMGEVKADKGIYLSFFPINDQQLSLYIINNTDWQLPFALCTGSDKNYKGLLSGFLEAKSYKKYGSDLKLKDFDDWSNMTFQSLYFNTGYIENRSTLIKRMRLRANSFFSQKKPIPQVGGEGYVFQLDADEEILTIDPIALKEKMLEVKIGEKSPEIKSFTEKPSSTIDLHIEQLNINYANSNSTQILEQQLRVFETNLEKAIASGMDEIIFIHGAGNGILKQEIQRHLSKHKNVAWFKDAQKEKFGYGATLVKIK